MKNINESNKPNKPNISSPNVRNKESKPNKPNNSNDLEQSVEYWVYQASKGENIAKCWQNIKKFISSELQKEREKVLEEVREIIDLMWNKKEKDTNRYLVGWNSALCELDTRLILLSKINKLK